MSDAMSSNDCCFGRTSSKSIGDTWPFCPKKPLLVGSMKLTLTIRAEFGNENPRSMIPFTTLNIVVTPQIPSASTTTASAQNPFSRRRTRKPTRMSWTRLVTIGVARCNNTAVDGFLFREFLQEGSNREEGAHWRRCRRESQAAAPKSDNWLTPVPPGTPHPASPPARPERSSREDWPRRCGGGRGKQGRSPGVPRPLPLRYVEAEVDGVPLAGRIIKPKIDGIGHTGSNIETCIRMHSKSTSTRRPPDQHSRTNAGICGFRLSNLSP